MASLNGYCGNLLLSSRQPLPEGLTDGDSGCNNVAMSLRKLSSSVVSCVTTLEASVASCVATAEARLFLTGNFGITEAAKHDQEHESTTQLP